MKITRNSAIWALIPCVLFSLSAHADPKAKPAATASAAKTSATNSSAATSSAATSASTGAKTSATNAATNAGAASHNAAAGAVKPTAEKIAPPVAGEAFPSSLPTPAATATPAVPSAIATPAVPPASTEPLPVDKAVVETEVAPPANTHFRRFGATVSANIPHPLFGELEFRITPHWSLGAGAGGAAVNNLNINSIPINVNMMAYDVRGRWHPWGGSFFLGVAAGVQKLSGAGRRTIAITAPAPLPSTVDTTITANLDSFYVTPHLGWLWIFNNGFTVGFDIGVQLPVKPSTAIDITTANADLNQVVDILQGTQEYKDLNTKVVDNGNTLGKYPLPYMTVLRLGWMF